MRLLRTEASMDNDDPGDSQGEQEHQNSCASRTCSLWSNHGKKKYQWRRAEEETVEGKVKRWQL